MIEHPVLLDVMTAEQARQTLVSMEIFPLHNWRRSVQILLPPARFVVQRIWRICLCASWSLARA